MWVRTTQSPGVHRDKSGMVPMKYLVMVWLFTWFPTTQSLRLSAQTASKSQAGFTLKLALAQHSGEIAADVQVLTVTYTNISKVKDPGLTCARWGVYNTPRVVYNGKLLEPTKEQQELDQRLDNHQCVGAFVSTNSWPRQSREDYIYYTTPCPGLMKSPLSRVPAQKILQKTWSSDPTLSLSLFQGRLHRITSK